MALAFDLGKAPLAIRKAIMKVLRESAPTVKSRATANLDRVLKRRTGLLAGSIYARARQGPFGGKLTVGTPILYGRFWEYGFLRGGKAVRGAARKHRKRSEAAIAKLIQSGSKLYHRPWLRPAGDASMAEIGRRLEIEVNRAAQEQFPNITIDLNLSM